jgi:hypothetical protein
LRAFLEALTAGWLSQVKPFYEEEHGKRFLGYKVFEEHLNQHQPHGRQSPPAIKPIFQPRLRPDQRIDVASYLFGLVVEPGAGTNPDEAGPWARKSKIWVEDAYMDENALVKETFWYPDLAGEPFMGGPDPRANTWWYFEPAGIEDTWVRGIQRAEFIGKRYRGRKFYYHQDPVACTTYYHPESGKWTYHADTPFHRVWMECVEAGKSSQPFRIYFDRMPHPLVKLLLLSLLPGRNIRHKLGYGKAYGYGSVEFALHAAHLRREQVGSGMPRALEDRTGDMQSWTEAAWDREQLKAMKLEPLIDWNALTYLAQVLGWQDHDQLLFTYPPYDSDNFKRMVRYSQVDATHNHYAFEARRLFPVKRTIHFAYYQSQSDGWATIEQRKP